MVRSSDSLRAFSMLLAKSSYSLQLREVHQQGDLRSDSSQRQKYLGHEMYGIILPDARAIAEESISHPTACSENSVMKARNESCSKLDRRRGRSDAEYQLTGRRQLRSNIVHFTKS